MAEQVHLFLEEEEVEALQAALKAHESGEVDLPIALSLLLRYILMWKEPA